MVDHDGNVTEYMILGSATEDVYVSTAVKIAENAVERKKRCHEESHQSLQTKN